MVIGVANQCDKGTPIIFIEVPGSFFFYNDSNGLDL